MRLDGAPVARYDLDRCLALMGDADGIALSGTACLKDRTKLLAPQGLLSLGRLHRHEMAGPLLRIMVVRGRAMLDERPGQATHGRGAVTPMFMLVDDAPGQLAAVDHLDAVDGGMLNDNVLHAVVGELTVSREVEPLAFGILAVHDDMDMREAGVGVERRNVIEPAAALVEDVIAGVAHDLGYLLRLGAAREACNHVHRVPGLDPALPSIRPFLGKRLGELRRQVIQAIIFLVGVDDVLGLAQHIAKLRGQAHRPLASAVGDDLEHDLGQSPDVPHGTAGPPRAHTEAVTPAAAPVLDPVEAANDECGLAHASPPRRSSASTRAFRRLAT